MRVFKPKRSRSWRVRFYVDGLFFDKPLRTQNKDVAEQRARELVKETELEMAGILSPKIQRDVAKTHLKDLLAEWIKNGLAPTTSHKHRKNSNHRVARVIEECGWKFVRDITSKSFEAWCAEKFRAGEIKAKTLNHYLSHVRCFLNWMKKREMIAVNPLEVVETLQEHDDPARSFTFEELAKLVATAHPYRAAVYTVAAYSGLRKGELRTLEWHEIDLESVPPVFKLKSSKTKNRQADILPIHRDAVSALRLMREMGKSPKRTARNQKVFYRGIPKSPRFRLDLEEAGVGGLDEQDRPLLFKGLRTTCGTFLASQNIQPRVAMELMRHSDMRLTMKTYTDASKLPLAEAIEKLPSLQSSPIASLNAGKSCPNVSISGEVGINENEQETSVSRSELVELGGVVQPCPKGKKVERVGFEPTVPCGTSVFKTDAFDHSATSPLSD